MRKAPTVEEAAREALRQACATLDAAELLCQPFLMSQALAGVARACRMLQDLPSAEAYLQQALKWARLAGSNDQVVDLLCEWCETAARAAECEEAAQAGSGHRARERARDHAFEASSLANRVADPGWEAKVLLRISDVLDRCGDRDDAVLLQTRALRLMAGGATGGRTDAAQLPGLGRLADS